MRTPAWLALLAASVAVAIFVEWHTDEVTVVVAVMLICAAAIGVLKPPLAPIAGALVGFSVLAAHAITEAAGTWRPGYMHAAPRPGDWTAMAVAGLAVTAAAWIAGLIRSKLS